MRQRSRVAAILFMVLGGLFLAFQSYYVHYLNFTYDLETVLAGRFVVGFLLLCGYLIFLHRPSTFVRKYIKLYSWKLSILSGICGFASVGCYFWSLKVLPLSVATSLFLSFPLLLPYAWKLKTSLTLSLSIIGGMILMCIGIVCMICFNNSLMAILALISGVLLLFWMSAIQVLHAQGGSFNIALHYLFIAALCAFVFFITCKGFHPIKLSATQHYSLLILGLVGVLCQLFFTLGIRYAAAWVVAPFIYSSVVFTFVLDRLFIQIPFELGSFFGLVLAVTGGVWIMRVLFKGARGNL
jgi:drug/metabolite transporter (DMT)-like permease